MMRIITAIIVWALIFGSVISFQRKNQLQRSIANPVVPETTAASAVYSLAVTPTFKAEPDPFALQTSETETAPALVVRMAGTDLLRVTDYVEAGRPLKIDTLADSKVGLNEIYIEGSPPASRVGQRHAILVELFRNGNWIQQQSIWSTPGSKVTGVIRFEVTNHEEDDDDDH